MVDHGHEDLQLHLTEPDRNVGVGCQELLLSAGLLGQGGERIHGSPGPGTVLFQGIVLQPNEEHLPDLDLAHGPSTVREDDVLHLGRELFIGLGDVTDVRVVDRRLDDGHVSGLLDLPADLRPGLVIKPVPILLPLVGLLLV